MRGSGPRKGVAKTTTNTERPGYRDRNAEIHERWTKAVASLESARKRGNAEKIRQAQNVYDNVATEFFLANRGLAVAMARPFLAPGDMNGDDYISAAALGLWEAFLKWDPTKGTTFGTFSRQYIKGRLVRGVRVTEFGHISQTDFNRRKEIRDTITRMTDELGRAATHQEVASVLGLTVDAVRRAIAPVAASLDVPVGDGEKTLGDMLGPDPMSIRSTDLDDQDNVDRMLDELNELEMWLVCARGELMGTPPQSLAEIADEIGVGREITRRAEAKAKARLVHTRLSMELGRLPSMDELAENLGVDAEKAETLLKPTWYDLHGRWVRAATALGDARRLNDLPAADRRRQRLDRIGEEVMQLGAELGAEAASSYADNEVPVGAEVAMSELWDAFRAWNAEEDVQFPAWVRRHWAARHQRVPRARQKARPSGIADAAPALWSRIRRSRRDLPAALVS